MASKQRGFTIVELMIAMSVFAVSITLVMAGVLHIARQYQQSASRTKLESASRNIHQQAAQGVQFSGKSVEWAISGNWKTYCVGNKRFTFANIDQSVDLAVGTYDAAPRGLYVEDFAGGACGVPAAPANTGINMLTDRSVVIRFEMTDSGLDTRFADADSDLLSLGSGYLPSSVTCLAGVAGKEYCSVVQLSSSFTRRVNL